MPIAIAVTSAELVLPPPDHHTPTAHVFTPPGRQRLEDALGETQQLLEQHGYLIVLLPTGTRPAVTNRLRTIRSVLESDRIALVEAELPPLATGVLVRQLRQLSVCDFSPGVLASAARLLTHYIHAGALLTSVARLDRVPVSLRTHAKSWVPGSQFGVVTNPTPQLIRIGGEATLQGPNFTTRLTVATGQLTSDWVTGTLAGQWRVQGLEQVELPPESARWWGTGKVIEFAAAISDIALLYQLVSSVRREECHWCGLELIGDRCAFCSATVSPPENQRHPGVVVRPGGRPPGRAR